MGGHGRKDDQGHDDRVREILKSLSGTVRPAPWARAHLAPSSLVWVQGSTICLMQAGGGGAAASPFRMKTPDHSNHCFLGGATPSLSSAPTLGPSPLHPLW